MAQKDTTNPADSANTSEELKSGSYEVIQRRLHKMGDELFSRMEKLNAKRKETFGALDSHFLAQDRIMTDNNCIPRDMVPIGDWLIFGYQVNLGLKSTLEISDVFSVYQFKEDHFEPADLSLIKDPSFERDLRDLYSYYKKSKFATFDQDESRLLMIFQIGEKITDIRAFKWQINSDGTLRYINSRADHEVKIPLQQDFTWNRTTRENHIAGLHPHVSIEDRIFVECINGDLTIKIENNTDIGAGIYSEPVEYKDQSLDDAEISYAVLNQLILLKIKPYREDQIRYIVFNEKTEKAVRIDEIGQCAIRLSDDDGIIFPRGYYLESGETKKFDLEAENMRYRQTFQSPNGEDVLYIFYNDDKGQYILLQYNIIEKKVMLPIFCHGFAIYDTGKMIFFKSDEEPKKSHALQIWQTPFAKENLIQLDQSSYLVRIGNKDLVKGIADIRALFKLIKTEKVFLGLYHQIVKRSAKILDFYHWLDHEEVANPKEIVLQINQIAKSAIDEYEKVVQIKSNTENELRNTDKEVNDLINQVSGRSYDNAIEYVQALSNLKMERGKVISIKELRYIDQKKVNQLEELIKENYERIAQNCVDFLLRESSLEPYYQQLKQQKTEIPQLTKAVELKETNQRLDQINEDLSLLMELINELKIEDTSKSSQIIESVSKVFSTLNQIKAIFKKQFQEIQGKEARIEFAAQFKLVSQAALNYMDQADSPEKCEELLTRIMIQFEELEGKFTDFDDFIEQIGEKRQEVYSAFQTRKIQQEEVRNKRCQSLWTSAERILNGIAKRASQFKNMNELNAYFASDSLVTKLIDIVEKLNNLGDSVKAEDINSRLKSLKQEGSRQLKDKLDLFTEGENIISFGQYQFAVNKQAVDLTMVKRGEDMFYQITGTEFFEKVDEKSFLKTRDFWNQPFISENKEIYRAEFLAYKIIQKLDTEDDITLNRYLKYMDFIVKKNQEAPDEDITDTASYQNLLQIIQDQMSESYTEGYEKGIHDLDCLKILCKLFPTYRTVGTMRFHPTTRAYGSLFWFYAPDTEQKQRLASKIHSLGLLNEVTRGAFKHDRYINELQQIADDFFKAFEFPIETIYLKQAGAYLFEELSSHIDKKQDYFPVNKEAFRIYKDFRTFLEKKHAITKFNSAIQSVGNDTTSRLAIVYDWVNGFINKSSWQDEYFLMEAAVLILGEVRNNKIEGNLDQSLYRDVDTACILTGLLGEHPRIQNNALEIDISDFLIRLNEYNSQQVPLYNQYVELKKGLIASKKEQLRLGEYKPQVMSSFVRNKLIDAVYLPLVGANLAKQIGSYGEKKRTDLMGLLLLISPPGYGKTTLMEYLANRLGLIFMKINCPAIGHEVTSLDPAQAGNATAKEEVEKLNLALEMGNNVMIYLDDIQHTNPEFLQKFISLCDAQRKIEGVYKEKTRTYDLRGKRVAVVMAGNPYTESGEKFQIPDMLTNRADVYNLGDILGGYEDFFKLSYLENSLTSNPNLAILASRSRDDVHQMIKIAQTDMMEGIQFTTNYSQMEINEYVELFKKLFTIQSVVLKVNELYIYSASQDEAFRREPKFLLQGSYRNMNRMAEKVVAVMNEAEVKQLILDHYTDDSQVLTKGAEFNLLRFKEMMGWTSDQENERLAFIRKTFTKNKALGNVGDQAGIGQIISQINLFNDQFSELIDVLNNKKKLDHN
ncbi:MAG: DNA repair ATPase [Spirochaetes bacterium]|nr:DNA repair ATPase [Spirochaetota bacterium]